MIKVKEKNDPESCFNKAKDDYKEAHPNEFWMLRRERGA